MTDLVWYLRTVAWLQAGWAILDMYAQAPQQAALDLVMASIIRGIAHLVERRRIAKKS